MKLTEKFTLEQFTRSDIATRFNIKEQYNPDSVVISKLKALCVNLMEPLYDAVKLAYPTAVLNITSGYRCKLVNYKAGGTDNSQHMAGEAADNEMRINDKECNILLAQLVLNKSIIFDQMILEYGTLNKPEWIHLSWDLDKKTQRNSILRIGHDDTGQFHTYSLSQKDVLNLK